MVFNMLLSHIKAEFDNPKKFKVVLQNFLHENSFCSLYEYFVTSKKLNIYVWFQIDIWKFWHVCLISVVPAGVHVTSPTLRCRWRRSYPRQLYVRGSSGNSPNVADITSLQTTVLRHSVVSLILVGVRVTSRILRSTGRRGHPPQRYISQSSTCFSSLQEITSLQTTVARSYSKCVAVSVMRTIRWDVNGIHVSTIRYLIRREGSD